MSGSSWTVAKASGGYLSPRLPEWTGGDWSDGVAMAILILKLGWDVVDTDELFS